MVTGTNIAIERALISSSVVEIPEECVDDCNIEASVLQNLLLKDHTSTRCKGGDSKRSFVSHLVVSGIKRSENYLSDAVAGVNVSSNQTTVG